MISGITEGLSAYLSSLSTIRKYNLGKYFLITGFIALALLAVIGSLSYFLSNNFIGAWYPENWVFSTYINTGIVWLSGVLFFVLGIIIYRHLLLVLVSPFMSFLSEEIERKSCGEQMSNSNVFNPKSFLKSIFRGLSLAIRNIFFEMFYTILLLILGLIIPPLSILVTPLLFILQSYYAGFGNFDYTLERKFNRSDSVRFVKDHRGFAIGNGIVFMLLILSVVGVVFAPVLAVSAATPGVLDRLEEHVD